MKVCEGYRWYVVDFVEKYCFGRSCELESTDFGCYSDYDSAESVIGGIEIAGRHRLWKLPDCVKLIRTFGRLVNVVADVL